MSIYLIDWVCEHVMLTCYVLDSSVLNRVSSNITSTYKTVCRTLLSRCGDVSVHVMKEAPVLSQQACLLSASDLRPIISLLSKENLENHNEEYISIYG